MELAQPIDAAFNVFKSAITYFFEDFKEFNNNPTQNSESDDLNYSFKQNICYSFQTTKREILQVLRNTVSLEKLVNWLLQDRTCDQLMNSQLSPTELLRIRFISNILF